MKNKNNVKENYLFNLFYNLLVLIIPLITMPYISRVLSVESIGANSYVHSIVLYFTAFVSLGTKSYAIKRISRAKNKVGVSFVFWNIFTLRLMFGLLALFVYFFICIFFIDQKTIAYTQSLYIVSVMIDISWFFQGLEQFKRIVLRNLFIKIISCILIFTCVKNDSDIIKYVLCLSGMTVIGNISLWPYLRRHITKFTKIKPFFGIKEILILFIPTLALQIYSAVDQTMLGIFAHSMRNNGQYEQSLKIVSALMTIVCSLSIVLLPKISFLFGKGKFNIIKSCMIKSYQFIQMISLPLCIGLISISDIFVPWFLGKKYFECIILVNIFSLLFIINGINDITGFQYLVATDRQKIYAISIVSGTVCNVFLNLLLIPALDAMGAVISSVISQLIVMIIQIGYIVVVTKEFSIFDIFGQAWKYALSSAVMYIMIILLKCKLPFNALGKLALLVPIGICLYFFVLVIMKDKMLLNFITTFYFKIRHKYVNYQKRG